MVTLTISKADAAANQLDWAIKLFLDHDAYLPAIKLAGAAEEVIGAALGTQSVFMQLKATFADRFDLPESVISQEGLNRARNWLKHWKVSQENGTVDLDLKNEAIQYILRAIANFGAYDRSATSESPRFVDWMSANWSVEHGA